MSTTAIRTAFEALEAAVPATLDGPEASEMLGHARRVRGWLDAVEAQVTSRVRELHETAGGAPAADEHARCGAVSAAEARRRDRRSKAIDAAPAFGDAMISCPTPSDSHLSGSADRCAISCDGSRTTTGSSAIGGSDATRSSHAS